MKRISGINDPIKSFEDGKSFKIGATEGGSETKDMTFKNIMLRMIGAYRCNDGEKAISVLALGVKLSTAEGDTFEYNDSENNADVVLKEIINANQLQLGAVILGYLYEKVKHAESYK